MIIDGKNKNRQTELILFFIIVVDILFLPYILHLPIKISMVLLLIYPILVDKKISRRVLINVSFMLLIAFVSIANGLIKETATNELLMSNSQTLIIIIYGYLVYEYIKDVSPRIKIDITPFLLSYLFVSSIFAIVYWINPTLFFTIRPFWTLKSSGELFISYSENRFSFIMSEPNNFAATINGIMVFLFLGNKITRKEKFIISLISLFLIISTQSISGTVVFALLQILFIFVKNKKIEPIHISTSRKIFSYLFSLICLVFLVYVLTHINKILSMDLLQSVTGRYDLYSNAGGFDITGKRKDVWIYMIENHNFVEYIIFGDASIGKPHSGHLYILYAFGLVFLIVFLSIFLFDNLKTRRAIILRTVFLIVFSTNTLIVDLRAFTLWAILLGLTCLEKSKKSCGVHYGRQFNLNNCTDL